MSLRTSPQTGVAAQLSATKERYRCGVPLAGAIRSKNVSIIWEFGVKTVVFKDADCHGHKWPRNDIAYLIPDSWPENPPNTGVFGCIQLFDKFLFIGLFASA